MLCVNWAIQTQVDQLYIYSIETLDNSPEPHTTVHTLTHRLEYFDSLLDIPSVEGVVVLTADVFTNLSCREHTKLMTTKTP